MQLRRCFTFIEVIVTVMIMTIVSALLIGVFHTGLMCYRKTDQYEKSALAIIGAVSMFKDDLKRFIPINSKRVVFSDNELAFYCVSPVPVSHMELVTYTFKNGDLRRMVVSYQGRNLDLNAIEENDGESLTLLSGIDSWKFSYIKSSTPRSEKDDKSQPVKTTKEQDVKYWPAAIVWDGMLHGSKAIKTSALMPVFKKTKSVDTVDANAKSQ